MQANELKGRAVVSLASANKIGQIDDVLFDAAYRMVLGFRVKRGLLHRAEALPRASVKAVGKDAITVADESAVNSEDRFAELAGALTLARAQGTKVVTEGGELLGLVSAITLDDEAQRVVSYQLEVPLIDRLRHRVPEVRAEDVLRFGESGIMIVPDSARDQILGVEAT